MSEPAYCSGEPIRVGDIVQYCESDYVVESVMTRKSPESSGFWEQQGEGVMLVGRALGRVYTKFYDEELFLIQRGEHETGS
jgi:hypothetical protein